MKCGNGARAPNTNPEVDCVDGSNGRKDLEKKHQERQCDDTVRMMNRLFFSFLVQDTVQENGIQRD
jgi:hypothetical protein